MEAAEQIVMRPFTVFTRFNHTITFLSEHSRPACADKIYIQGIDLTLSCPVMGKAQKARNARFSSSYSSGTIAVGSCAASSSQLSRKLGD